MHGQKILYRDLKPENPLDDDEGHVRLIDMGLAVRWTGESRAAPARRHRLLHGVRGAGAQNREAYGMTADWYTVGVLLYEFTNGALPSRTATRRSRSTGRGPSKPGVQGALRGALEQRCRTGSAAAPRAPTRSKSTSTSMGSTGTCLGVRRRRCSRASGRAEAQEGQGAAGAVHRAQHARERPERAGPGGRCTHGTTCRRSRSKRNTRVDVPMRLVHLMWPWPPPSRRACCPRQVGTARDGGVHYRGGDGEWSKTTRS